MFTCFTNCGNMSLFDLVMASKNIDFKSSIKFITDIVKCTYCYEPKIGFGTLNLTKSKSILDIEVEILNRIDKPFLHRTYPQKRIKQWEEEGISFEAIKNFDVRYDIENNRVVIPHMNINNEVVGIRVRAFNKYLTKRYGKYYPLWLDDKGYNHPLGKNLYGLNKNKENIRHKKKVFIFEGEKSVLKFETIYPKNNIAVATCGSSFSNYQKKMILDLGVTEIIIAYDRQFQELEDDDCTKWWNKIKKMTKNLYGLVDVYVLWDVENLLSYKDSPIDKGKDVFEKLLKNKIKVGD
ncbi:hypothetical protein ACHDX1_003500 [Clostridioides difficile]|nr:hypothetical protein [Clostridioides difficile]